VRPYIVGSTQHEDEPRPRYNHQIGCCRSPDDQKAGTTIADNNARVCAACRGQRLHANYQVFANLSIQVLKAQLRTNIWRTEI